MPTLKQVAAVLALFLAQAFVPPFGFLVVASAWLGHPPGFFWVVGIALVSLAGSLPLLYGRRACLPSWVIGAATLLTCVAWLGAASAAGLGDLLFVGAIAGLGAAGTMARRSSHLEHFLAEARNRRAAHHPAGGA